MSGHLTPDFMAMMSGLVHAMRTVTVRVPPASSAAGAGDFSIAVWDATIWRRDASGDWRIAVDISSLLPPSTT
jgi:hypothetical protein